MSHRPFLERQVHRETAKVQAFYVVVTFFEGLFVSFLSLFLNEVAKSLGWTPIVRSLALFLAPLCYSLFTLFLSHFVKSQRENLKTMRLLLLLSFFSILSLILFGLLAPKGYEEGAMTDKDQYVLYSAFIIALSAISMGFYGAFSVFHVNNVADINFAEKTRFGQAALYASLSPILASPLGGFLATLLPFSFSFEGYLFLFGLSLPLLALLFGLTYIFKPFPKETFHDEAHEKTPYRLLLHNRAYLFYLLLAALWIPSLFAGDSLTSSLWTAYERIDHTSAFDARSYGFYVAVSALFEFLFIYLNTHFGFGKKVRSSMHIAFFVLLLMGLSLGTIAYLHPTLEVGQDVPYAIALILLHSGRGMAYALHITSNMVLLTHLLGPKMRRKAVFLAQVVYQGVNALLQFLYPLLENARYIGFFALAGVALLGFGFSFLLDVHILHKRKTPAR